MSSLYKRHWKTSLPIKKKVLICTLTQTNLRDRYIKTQNTNVHDSTVTRRPLCIYIFKRGQEMGANKLQLLSCGKQSSSILHKIFSYIILTSIFTKAHQEQQVHSPQNPQAPIKPLMCFCFTVFLTLFLFTCAFQTLLPILCSFSQQMRATTLSANRIQLIGGP